MKKKTRIILEEDTRTQRKKREHSIEKGERRERGRKDRLQVCYYLANF